MTIHRLLTAAAAASLLAGAAMAQAPAQAPAAAAAPSTPAPAAATAGKLVPNGDLIATLRLNSQFTTFVKALDATNLSSLLKSSPGLTVFAPTDAAFPQSKLDTMLADKTGLQKTLLHYIINARIDSSKIKGAHGPVPSGAGDQIVLDGTGAVLKADNANIIQADVMASNGVIHVVDALMIPGSVPATLPEATPEAAPAAAAPPAEAAPPPKAPAKKKKK
jgi:uncharacterized surface protein with fasciclin (FAS1) repeats